MGRLEKKINNDNKNEKIKDNKVKGFFHNLVNKRWKKALLIVFGLILVAAIGVFVYLQLLLGSMEKVDISTSNEDLGISEEETAYHNQVNGVTNVALFGIDSFDGTKGRSDSIMIVSIDENTKKIKLTSIPRDSYVNIPGRGMDKINHAYSYGGPELALSTLNSNFGLDIKYFASVNFTSLPKIIDALGGVSITVTASEAGSGSIPGINRAGSYVMNGDQALGFSRIRKIDNDFERGRRQRDVIEAIINKLLGQSVTSYPRTLGTILPLVTTNMRSSEVLSIGTSAVTKGIGNIEKGRYPLPEMAGGKMINGVYYYVFDIEATRDLISRYIYLDQK